MITRRVAGVGATVAVLVFGLAAGVGAQSTESESQENTFSVPQDPSFLIGTWHITEVIYPGTDREYVEVTVRVCEQELLDLYVVCRMQSNGRGRKRESWFLVNQHAGEGSIEFVGVFTNVPYKTIYQGQFLADGSGIDLQSYQVREDAMTPGTFQTLRFLSEDEFEWRIGITNPGTPEESVIGIERAVRVST